MNFKYGKVPPRPGAPRVTLASYLLAAPESLPAPPAECRWDSAVATWPMYGNDRIGDCTAAAAAHMIECWSEAAGAPVVPFETDVIAAYSAITGYDPSTGTNDTGALETDVLTYWCQAGICGNTLSAWATYDPRDLDMMRRAVYVFGGAYIGIEVRAANEQQFAAGEPWDYCGAPWNPVVGLHAVPILGYDTQYFYACSWGRIVPVTTAFLAHQADEAHALVDRAFVGASGAAPNHVNLDRLEADLQSVNSR